MLLGKEERYGRWIDGVGLIPALIVGGVITASVAGDRLSRAQTGSRRMCR